jgi:hypothetical protein
MKKQVLVLVVWYLVQSLPPLWSQATRAILSQPEQLLLYRGILNRIQTAIPDGSSNYRIEGNNLVLSPVGDTPGAYDVLVRGQEEASILFIGHYGDTLSRHVFQVWDLPAINLRLNNLKNNDSTDVLTKGLLSLTFEGTSPFLPKTPEVKRWIVTRTDINQVSEGVGPELSAQALQSINETPAGVRIAIDAFYTLPGVPERIIRSSVIKLEP